MHPKGQEAKWTDSTIKTALYMTMYLYKLQGNLFW